MSEAFIISYRPSRGIELLRRFSFLLHVCIMIVKTSILA